MARTQADDKAEGGITDVASEDEADNLTGTFAVSADELALPEGVSPKDQRDFHTGVEMVEVGGFYYRPDDERLPRIKKAVAARNKSRGR